MLAGRNLLLALIPIALLATLAASITCSTESSGKLLMSNAGNLNCAATC